MATPIERRGFLTRLVAVASLACAVVLVIAPMAHASNLVQRNAKKVRLQVNNNGVALVTFRAKGKNNHILYWGAINQKEYFKKDRSGGWKSHKADWKNFNDTCRKYKGPPLSNPGASGMASVQVKIHRVCTARDGSHWAVQSWKRIVRSYGSYAKAPTELRISHWRGNYATLDSHSNWTSSGERVQIYGQLKYKGKPWYALAWGATGQVNDGHGRNISIDSYNSDFGSGWRRVNSILTHRPSGQYCYIFGPKPPVTNKWGYSPAKKYRMGVPGPGVTPDIFLHFTSVTYDEYDEVVDDEHDAIITALIGSYTGKHSCNTNN